MKWLIVTGDDFGISRGINRGIVEARRSAGEGPLRCSAFSEVLRSVGRRDSSRADRRRGAPAAPGCGRRGGYHRAQLPPRLCGTGVPLELRGRTRGGIANVVRTRSASGVPGEGHPPDRVPRPADARCLRRRHASIGGCGVITVVISVYKVANFPDGGGHFWVYMQYAQGLRRLGCDVYWLEQFRAPVSGDSAQEAALLSPFSERMKRFGLEGKTLLYAKAGNDFRFVGCEWPDVERVLKRADLLLNFHYAIDPRLLACARRTALVDIDPGLLQFWISTGQLNVPAHDCYLTTGETVGTPSARFSDCGLPWHRIRPPEIGRASCRERV